MTTKEAAKLWGVTRETVAEYCTRGIVPGAKKDEKEHWVIPNGSPKPMSKDKLGKILCAMQEGEQIQVSKLIPDDTAQARVMLCYVENLNLVHIENGNTYLSNDGYILVNKEKNKRRKFQMETVLGFVTELIKIAQIVVPVLITATKTA